MARGKSKVPRGQSFPVDLQFREAPRAEPEGAQFELQHAFDKPVLELQMLRGEKRSLCPDDRLKLSHSASN